MTWLEMFEKNTGAHLDSVKDSLVADELLRLAAMLADVDWCIARLQELKDTEATGKTMLDIVLSAGQS